MPALQIYQKGEAYYLVGAGATPCLRWARDRDRWLPEPSELPPAAIAVEIGRLPTELREELLAFAARADAMGAVAWRVNGSPPTPCR